MLQAISTYVRAEESGLCWQEIVTQYENAESLSYNYGRDVWLLSVFVLRVHTG